LKIKGHSFSLLFLGLLCSRTVAGGEATNGPARPERIISYTNVVDPSVPWSIHVVKVDFSQRDLRFCTTLGGGDIFGMEIVSEQIKTLPRELGQPLAAINGDFYDESQDFPVRPRDVQIRQGELVTHPAGHTSFWIDPEGKPRMTNIVSRFRVVWPDGKETPFGLNVQREEDAVVLYTVAAGKSTPTKAGAEYILERSDESAWLPLRAGQVFQARIRAVRNNGNSALDRETMVLSVGPKLLAGLPALQPGAKLRIHTETFPDLAGVDVAIGGGPALVKNGHVLEWKGWIKLRHPRTALGWNERHLFLVEVDGRQIDLSVGMTFPELADCMISLGCTEAMNLDGGGSATLWAFGSVRNSPSEGQERPAPNALVVVRKNSPRETK
jgi:hypothetical protein